MKLKLSYFTSLCLLLILHLHFPVLPHIIIITVFYRVQRQLQRYYSETAHLWSIVLSLHYIIHLKIHVQTSGLINKTRS